MQTKPLSGRSILVAEDEAIVALDLAESLRACGATVLLAATVDRALNIVEHNHQVDGAVIDINLRGKLAYPVAEALRERDIPFVFATGYAQSFMPATYARMPHCSKPVDVRRVIDALAA